MTENNVTERMFVLLALADGIETLANVLELLNDRWVSWRNTRTSNVSMMELLPSIREAIRLGLVDLWHPDGSGELSPMSSGVDAMLTVARTDPDAVWFRLTTKGRQVVEAWELPKGFDKLLFEDIASIPSGIISLDAAYHLLSQHADSRLDYAEFADLINALVKFDRVRLWHSSSTKPDKTSMTPVPALPPELYSDQAPTELANKEMDYPGYFLTLGKKAPSSQMTEPLAHIPDPVILLAKLKERSPYLLEDFADRKGLLHVIVDERNSISVGIRPMREFMERMRWSRGLPGLDNLIIRHITIDETGRIIGDYFGPASSDTLGMA